VVTKAGVNIFGQEKNPLPLLDIKPQFLSCPAHSLITVSKELS
jgi:hypothetical protein